MAPQPLKLSADEVRSARRRIAKGESRRAVARALGVDPRGLARRIAVQEKAEALDQADAAEARREQSRAAKRREHSAAPAFESEHERPEDGYSVPGRGDEARAALQAQLDAEEQAKALERADRARRYGFPGPPREETEKDWLNARDAAPPPTPKTRWLFLTYDGRKVGAFTTGTSTDGVLIPESDAERKAERLRAQHGLIELVRESEYAARQ